MGTTPVRADDMDARDFPGAIQSATSEQLAGSASVDISSYLSRRFGGVHIHSTQGNPLQPDLYYRGYAASPLLGLPMGITVYQNGVRLNEPLGDAVNWELVPMNAIASLSLLSGANSLYGLNTLGGSVVMLMKDGFSHPQHSIEVEGGSFGRAVANIESGGNNGDLAYYVNAQRIYERGWRDLSASWAENVYANLDWRGDRSRLAADFHLAESNLTGNGLVPSGLLRRGREQIFTAPDITGNDSAMLVLRGGHTVPDRVDVSANLYYRSNDTASFNGDALDEEEVDELIDDGFGGAVELARLLPGACRDAVEDGLAERGLGFESVEDDEFADAMGESGCSAINNISGRAQESVGGVIEFDLPLQILGFGHDFSAGAGFYRGSSAFISTVQFALFDPLTRSTTTSQAVAGGIADDRTEIDTRIERVYVYAGDRFAIGNDWSVSLSSYFHDSRIELGDQTGTQPQLNGEHDFQDFNWGIGAIRRWTGQVDVYASYNQSSRLPTPIELACSEELSRNRITGEVEECRLPNAFLADPPLDEVIAKNFDFGLRGTMPEDWNWSLGAFHTLNENDIIWQTGQTRSHGLFRNVDKTRRLGVEAALAAGRGGWSWNVSYSYVLATFEDEFDVLSPNHPANTALRGDDDDEQGAEPGDGVAEDDEPGGRDEDDDEDETFSTRPVGAGNEIPGIPNHLLKAALNRDFTDRFSVGAEMIAVAGSHLRGDESNELDILDGYVTFNAVANYRGERFDAYVLVENLFDNDYENFGLIGEEPNEIIGLDDIGSDVRFLAPGAPLALWAGIKVYL